MRLATLVSIKISSSINTIEACMYSLATYTVSLNVIFHISNLQQGLIRFRGPRLFHFVKHIPWSQACDIERAVFQVAYIRDIYIYESNYKMSYIKCTQIV